MCNSSTIKVLSFYLLVILVSGVSMSSVKAQQKYLQAKGVDSCACSANAEKLNWGPRFYMPMKDQISYELFHQLSGWFVRNGAEDFKIIYIDNFRNNNSFGQTNWQFDVVGDKIPVEIIHPQNAFKINLTPCVSPSKAYHLPVSFSFTTNRADNYSKPFHGSAKGYLDLILEQLELDRFKFLKNHLFYLATHNIDNYNSLQTRIAKKYGLSRNLEEVNQVNYHAKIEALLQALRLKKILPEDIMLDEFILDDVAEAKISKTEKNRLTTLFKSNEIFLYINERSEEIYLYNYSAYFGTRYVKLEFHSNVLAQNITGEVFPFLCSVEDLTGSSKLGLEMNITEACIENAMFAGSKMKISTTNAQFVSPLASRSQKGSLQYANYPLFRKKVKQGQDEVLAVNQKDSYTFQLQNFTGLLLPFAKVDVPYKQSSFLATGKDIIMNNHLVSGMIEIPIYELSGDGKKFKIPTKNNAISTDIEELRIYFDHLGFTTQNTIEESSIAVFFKKTFLVDNVD